MDPIDERLSRMEDLLHQLVGMVGKNTSAMADLKGDIADLKSDMAAVESRLNARIDGVEQRLSGLIKEVQRDVTVLQSQSDHFARKIGVLERDVAVLRNQA